jgi:hypothetical protein
MSTRRSIVLTCLSLVLASASAGAECALPELADQKPDAATIQRLEKAWSTAFLRGDTHFEECLLTPDFTEIKRTGKIDQLSDELALAASNKGKPTQALDMPPVTVHLHDNAAVAYGKGQKVIDGKTWTVYYADYYLWKDGAWHAYFGQQTAFLP